MQDSRSAHNPEIEEILRYSNTPTLWDCARKVIDTCIENLLVRSKYESTRNPGLQIIVL